MIIFIDGVQLSGKTTLIKEFEKINMNNYKFDFPKYTSEFHLKKKDLKGFQLGKDLSMLSLLKNFNNDLIVDRGIYSSIYYSLLYKRMSKKDILKLLDIIAKNFNEFIYIFIYSKNSQNIIRDKKDGFDNLDKSINYETLLFINNESKKRNIKFTLFVNDFNLSIEENFKTLRNVIYEHIRG